MNQYTRSQFMNSTLGKPVIITGKLSLTTAVKATLVNQGVTLTAVLFGVSGNSITYALTAGATAGAEVVTVVGNAISVQIESGVSTVTQVRTAINASGAAAALVLATGTSASTVTAPLVATALSGGVNGVASNTLGSLVASAVRSGVGEYTVTLAQNYNAVGSISFQLQAATAVDLVPQIRSVDVVSAKTIIVRLLAGATATEIAADAVLYMTAILNASSV